MCQFANVVKEDDAKALLFVQVRKHVRDLARTEGLLSAVTTWPANKHLSPLSIDPQTLLKAHKLSDVTWHDIPERRWRFLTEEERTQLREDVWHYSRTYVSEDLARAASALADELEEDRLKLTNAFGVSFAFDLPSAELPGDEEVLDRMSGHMRMSLFDWVSLNRRDLQERAREKIHAFIEERGGSMSIQQREDLEVSITPASAAVIEVVEASLGDFQRDLLRERFGGDGAPLGQLDAVGDRGVRVHVPFGEDPASHLEEVHKAAWRWLVCQRKMGLFRLMSAPPPSRDLANQEAADAWHKYKENVEGVWAFPDLTPQAPSLL